MLTIWRTIQAIRNSTPIWPCLRSSFAKVKASSGNRPTRSMSTYGYVQSKALVYSSNGAPKDVLSLQSHSISPPHSNLVTLRTLAAPLNPADMNQIQGTYPAKPPFTTDLGTPQPSAVPGNEGCFEVLSSGSGVKSVAKGDWVMPRRTGLGTWRTHMQTSEDMIIKVADSSGLTARQVATVNINPVTAWRMLTDFEEMREGDWFIQNGANSGVGRAAMQLGRQWGLKSIAVVRKREDTAQQNALETELKELGADVVRTTDDVEGEEFTQRVKEQTDGKVKLALNCVGGSLASQMGKVIAKSGTMVTYGAMARSPIKVGAAALIFQDLKYRGFWVSKWADEHPEEKQVVVEKILSMYREGIFKDVPYDEIPWKRETTKETLANAAQETLEGYRKGKGLFVFDA